MSALLEVTGVTKRYPGVVANDNVSLTVNAGEVVALLGENGAGKSTLLKAVFGLIKPDSGEIKIGGTPIVFGDTAGVISRGVGMVHQHFQLVPVMTVAENLILGDEPKRGLFINQKAARAEIIALSKRYGLEVDPDAVIEDLPVGMQQRVEILKALRKDVKLLILDEPTAVLTPQEIDELLGVIRNLAKSGVGVVLITHKLHEVMAVADRVVVLRGGKLVGTTTPKETDEAGLAQMMVGRSVVLQVNRTEAKRGAIVLEVKGLQVRDDRKILSVKGVDLVLHKGEILGVAGVEGNGQRELVEAICGMRHREEGEVLISGVASRDMAPHSVHEAGISHVPEDREKHGLVANYSIADNLVLNQFDQAPFAKGWIRNLGEVAKNAEQLVEKFDIRTPSAFNLASSLSGGNKQKVVVARELSQELPVLVAAQPTRGVDVGSIEFIHNQLISARDNGAGVLLVSAELDEILSLSDRIAVMSGGKIVAIVDSKDADRNYIGRLMAGLKE
ncbi:ABC transporter ATP-binding protein [Candidatus Planktophila lacus]|jgi:simple sugar transport system ATP-binding protein|uniref:Simple sugar transport system ATP-binding protein n=1 Tax=Candidatus Planktophila lacus TaxID=1884913 RepID=A0AAD0E4E2_9ACTN|nr:ABC transporter ATP-binding protein [Candidatus Planktophila lacus]ASY10385.1 simple sugar transport system ATP-binding protein [Candidatus Planktophila lacus]